MTWLKLIHVLLGEMLDENTISKGFPWTAPKMINGGHLFTKQDHCSFS